MSEFTCELPLPPKALSPNRSGTHWAVRAKATKEYRKACAWIFWNARPVDWPQNASVTLDVEYRCFRGCGGYEAKDAMNAMSSLKSGVDGMVDAGVIPSDAKKWLAWGSLKLLSTARETKRVAGVFVRVRTG